VNYICRVVTNLHDSDSLTITLPHSCLTNKLCGRPPQYAAAPFKLTFDLESGVRVTCGYPCANLVFLPIVFLGLSVLDLGPMYITDRQTSDTSDR